MPLFFSSLLATLVTIPLLGYIIVFVAAKQLTKNHRRAVQAALDFSTLLLIISVHYLVMTIWGQSYLWAILLALLILAMVFTVLHWKIRQEIILQKVFRGYWRFNFVLFFFAYLGLTLFGLIQRVAGLISLP